jgi:hypothetical protein
VQNITFEDGYSASGHLHGQHRDMLVLNWPPST